MALPQRNDWEEPERGQNELPGRGRARRARIFWWWLWIIAAGLVIWWAVWGRGGYGDWWGSGHGYHTGTNGGRVSQPLGQTSNEPSAEDTHSALGASHNPNTGVPQHAKPGGTVVTGPGSEEPGNDSSGAEQQSAAPASATQQH